jgi:hypothetical protein
MSSSELQYIVELGGQQLLPIPWTNDNTSISKCLQLLKDKTHAWFKFDIHSFETVSIPAQFHGTKTSLANGHLCLWNEEDDSAKIFPVLPKPSSQTIQRDWSPGSLCSLPNTTNIDVLINPGQNLVAIAYATTLQSGDPIHICIRALDGFDGVHPKAAGQKLILSELPRHCDMDSHIVTENVMLDSFGRHIALRGTLVVGDADSTIIYSWWLQIWDWQHSTTSNVSASLGQ